MWVQAEQEPQTQEDASRVLSPVTGDAKNQTWDLLHVKQLPCPWAMIPYPIYNLQIDYNICQKGEIQFWLGPSWSEEGGTSVLPHGFFLT